jgi:hypothetical protein
MASSPGEGTFSDEGTKYRVADLWKHAEQFPVRRLAVAVIWEQHRKVRCLGDEFVRFSPEALVASKELLAPVYRMSHMARVHRADLLYPILITKDGWVADGMHRLIKAHLEGEKAIKAVVLETMPEPLPAPTAECAHCRRPLRTKDVAVGVLVQQEGASARAQLHPGCVGRWLNKQQRLGR